jgi:hypothetical protein
MRTSSAVNWMSAKYHINPFCENLEDLRGCPLWVISGHFALNRYARLPPKGDIGRGEQHVR